MYTRRQAKAFARYGVVMTLIAVSIVGLVALVELFIMPPPLVPVVGDSRLVMTGFLFLAGGGVLLLIVGISFLFIGFVGTVFLQKHPEGSCQQCGYDLRGQIERRCPECGTAY